jgi:hypothetical protein
MTWKLQAGATEVADDLKFSGADLRHIRRTAARDVLDDRDPERLIRILDQIYTKGFRDGFARGRRAPLPRT